MRKRAKHFALDAGAGQQRCYENPVSVISISGIVDKPMRQDMVGLQGANIVPHARAVDRKMRRGVL